VDCGAHDGKLLCVPEADPRQREIRSIRQIAVNQLEEVAEFFRTYKNLEGRVVEISGWLDADAVPALLERCIAAASVS
jgi:inorganic pyrophosphatase